AAREAERQAAVARAAAAREAFEARITARANRAIASVCTGCLGPVPPSVALAPPDAVAAPPRLVPASVAMTDP
ncbi:serine/threonine protein kinase, partial [Methylobacterium sp. IF7SW-B2]|nr:serine/threonine protein kinase [Methylobacterium ajmalii]